MSALSVIDLYTHHPIYSNPWYAGICRLVMTHRAFCINNKQNILMFMKFVTSYHYIYISQNSFCSFKVSAELQALLFYYGKVFVKCLISSDGKLHTRVICIPSMVNGVGP
jgi:hypothetical protein